MPVELPEFGQNGANCSDNKSWRCKVHFFETMSSKVRMSKI